MIKLDFDDKEFLLQLCHARNLTVTEKLTKKTSNKRQLTRTAYFALNTTHFTTYFKVSW